MVVVGAVNIDISGVSRDPIVLQDSNPGGITIGFGGVGRNIAQNLTLLGVEVKLLTAFGQDDFTELVKSSCVKNKIDISHALTIGDESSSMYLSVCDKGGEMIYGIADMDVCNHITVEYVRSRLPIINNASLLVVDANIPEETICYLAQNATVPIFAEPVSTQKATKLRSVLGLFDTIKPNRLEAIKLTGVSLEDETCDYAEVNQINESIDHLLKKGVKNVFVSLGSDGVIAANNQERYNLPARPTLIKNVTGAGDAFMAGLVYARLKNKGLLETAHIAQIIASITLESEYANNPLLSEDLLRRYRSSQ